jgi:ATP-binding cassette, subfamily B, bacterial CvaB/MchF/RaxB
MRRRLPMIRQSETSECGSACLAMVAGFYGHKIDMATMRRRYSTSLRGMTLQHITAAAQQLQLASRAIRIELADIGDVKLPCILHWEMSHFVVLRAVRKNRITVHDPANGIRHVRLAEANRSFTGIALELWPTESFSAANESDPVTIRELLGSVSGLGLLASQALTLAALIELISLCAPMLLQWIVDHVIMHQAGGLSSAVIGMLLFGIFETLTTAARDRSTINLERVS